MPAVDPNAHDLHGAHAASIRHRTVVLVSERCACFHCERTFLPGDIRRWTDHDDRGVGQTALCPYCGIDSVLGSASGYAVTPAFLAAMRDHWFRA